MLTGRQTLTSIERAIAQLHGEEGQLDQALRSAVGEAERLRKERGEALRELARVKLDELMAGRLVNQLDAGERRAMQILDDYRMRIAATAERRGGLLQEVTSAEGERDGAAAAVEAALESVETLRAEAEARVRDTAPWYAAKEAFDAADRIATEAERKAQSSETELGAKKKPYDDDPLFAYLWHRRFGTSEYRAGNLARVIDRAVADFIGYADARPNYAALMEIPLRLREHANARRASAIEMQEALARIERQAMIEGGIETEEQVLAEARHRLAIADDTVEKKRALLSKIDEERAKLVAGGTDPSYNEALVTVTASDSSDDIATLYREAQRTPSDADEAIVRRLERIDAQVAKIDSEIAALRRSAQELARRRLEVERVRDRFRSAGYDHPRGTFGNDGDIAEVLKRVLAGAVKSGVLWDILRQGYGSRPPRGRPDFGSPSFPFPFPLPGGGTIGSAGGGWREPSSRGGWRPGSSDHDGGRDDDGFTTGGSF
jgi:hypothetical protein